MLEGRKAQFVDELIQQGSTRKQAEQEVVLSIDRLVYYAGWCDKFQQIFSSVNPVASSHFNFSVPEATGVVSVIAPEETSLLGLVSVIAPIIAGGNTCVVLASETKPLCAVTFAEVINTSDVPGGVVNILTGNTKELLEHFSSHMDVNAIVYCRNNKDQIKLIGENAALNVKRVFIYNNKDWSIFTCAALSAGSTPAKTSSIPTSWATASAVRWSSPVTITTCAAPFAQPSDGLSRFRADSICNGDHTSLASIDRHKHRRAASPAESRSNSPVNARATSFRRIICSFPTRTRRPATHASTP